MVMVQMSRKNEAQGTDMKREMHPEARERDKEEDGGIEPGNEYSVGKSHPRQRWS